MRAEPESEPHPSKRPVTPLAGPYGHPFHPILVTVPIGAWVASLVFDVASRVTSDPAVFVRGSYWLIGIGLLGAAAAAMVGFLDLLAIPTGTRAFRTVLWHMAINLTVTAAYLANFLLRGAAQDPGAVPVGLLALSVASLAGLAAGGWLGGNLAYRYGVRVAAEATQAEGFTAPDRTASDVRTPSEGH
ncbi:MAG: DUF2231 domain-containing protein [Streptosporangiales bacterium]|nr:DUF2231 domain-containing protein [Streptosporangiales bacterium]